MKETAIKTVTEMRTIKPLINNNNWINNTKKKIRPLQETRNGRGEDIDIDEKWKFKGRNRILINIGSEQFYKNLLYKG